MRGMNRETGTPLSGIEHLKQSIIDILTTPVGSRVMRRDYGSHLFSHLDHPMNDETRLDMIADTFDALRQWEPRIAVERVNVAASEAGKISLSLIGQYKPDGTTITLEGIEIK